VIRSAFSSASAVNSNCFSLACSIGSESASLLLISSTTALSASVTKLSNLSISASVNTSPLSDLASNSFNSVNVSDGIISFASNSLLEANTNTSLKSAR